MTDSQKLTAVPTPENAHEHPHSLSEMRHDEQYIAESFRSGEYPYKRKVTRQFYEQHKHQLQFHFCFIMSALPIAMLTWVSVLRIPFAASFILLLFSMTILTSLPGAGLWLDPHGS